MPPLGFSPIASLALTAAVVSSDVVLPVLGPPLQPPWPDLISSSSQNFLGATAAVLLSGGAWRWQGWTRLIISLTHFLAGCLVKIDIVILGGIGMVAKLGGEFSFSPDMSNGVI